MQILACGWPEAAPFSLKTHRFTSYISIYIALHGPRSNLVIISLKMNSSCVSLRANIEAPGRRHPVCDLNKPLLESNRGKNSLWFLISLLTLALCYLNVHIVQVYDREKQETRKILLASSVIWPLAYKWLRKDRRERRGTESGPPVCAITCWLL